MGYCAAECSSCRQLPSVSKYGNISHGQICSHGRLEANDTAWWWYSFTVTIQYPDKETPTLSHIQSYLKWKKIYPTKTNNYQYCSHEIK